MKIKFFLFFLLLSMGLFAQDQTQEIISQGDSVFYIQTISTVPNGTDFPDTSQYTKRIGDSTALVNHLFDIPYANGYIHVADGMKKALQRKFVARAFNNVSGLFQSFSGFTLYQWAGQKFFSSLGGRYRVFYEDNTSFFANIIQLPSGALRLVGEGGQGTFVVNSLGPDAFILMAFDHDKDGTSTNHSMWWDGVTQRKVFWPTAEIDKTAGNFKVVKTK
jgi:hypothetical protein